jgi:hypothetical protein
MYTPACNNNCILFPFQFIHDGYVVLDDFLTAKEVEELRKSGDELIQNIPDESHKAVFSTTDSQQVAILYVVSYTNIEVSILQLRYSSFPRYYLNIQ